MLKTDVFKERVGETSWRASKSRFEWGVYWILHGLSLEKRLRKSLF